MSSENRDLARLHALATSLRSEASLRVALERWLAQEVHLPSFRAASGRLRLGASIETTMDALGDDLPVELVDDLVEALVLQRDRGARADTLVTQLAEDLECASDQTRSVAASIAGMRLSARLIAGLPLAFLPLMPAARASITDGTGSVLVALGLALGWAGWVWLRRLEPRSPSNDAIASFCGRVAALLDAGTDLFGAFEVAARRDADLFEPVLCRVRLGMPWSEALASDELAPEVSAAIERSRRDGLDIASLLRGIAKSRRESARVELERRVKRAPVLMVLPLVLCVLPSFCLIAFGPFLRSLVSVR